jgi:hypothetical protein
MSGTNLKPRNIRVPQIVASALLVIGLVAYAQQSSDKPVIFLSIVSKLDRSQAGIYGMKVGKIDVIAVSDGTVGLGLTKELVKNAKPGDRGFWPCSRCPASDDSRWITGDTLRVDSGSKF